MPTYQLTSPRTGRTYGVQAAAELPDDDIDALVNDLDFEAAREAGVQPGVDPAVLQQGPLGSFAQSIPQTFSKVGSGMIGGAGRILDKASESLSQATGLPKGGDMFQRMADYGDELSTSADLTFPTNPQNPVAGTIGSGAAQGLSLLAGGLAGKALTGSNVAMTAVPAVSGFLSGANEGIQQAERIGVQSPLAQLGTGLAFGGVEVLTERLGGIGSKAATEALTQAVRQTAGQMMKKAGKAVGSEAFEEVLAGRSQAALTRLIASEDPANPGFTTTGVKLDDLAREIVNLEAMKLEALGGAAGGTVFAGVQALANRQFPNDPTTPPNQTPAPTQAPAPGQPGAPAPMGAGAPGAAAVSPLIGIAQRGGAVDVTLPDDTGALTAEDVEDLETLRQGDLETETVPTPGAGAIRPQPGPSRVTEEGSIPSTAPQRTARFQESSINEEPIMEGDALTDLRIPRSPEAIAESQRIEAERQQKIATMRMLDARAQGMPLIPDSPSGSRDILDFANENPIYLPPGFSEQRNLPEYEKLKEAKLPPYWRQFVASSKRGGNPSDVAQRAFDAGFIDAPTADAYLEAVRGGIEGRQQYRVQFAQRDKALQQEEERVVNFEQSQDKLARKRSTERVDFEDIRKGDAMTIDGEPAVVRNIEYDQDGYLTNVVIEDGKRFGLMQFDPQTRGGILVDEFQPRSQRSQEPAPLMLPSNRLGRGLADMMPGGVPSSRSQVPSSGQLETSNLKPATLASAYTTAARGQSSQMLPLAEVFAAAQQQNPALTPAQFQAQVMAEYEAGTVLLEGSGSRQEAESAGLRIDGTPVGTAVRMMVVGNPALQNPASGATRAAMATDPGAAQNAEPSPGGLIDDATGLPLNEDGTVTLYHGTSLRGAQEIRQTQTLKSAGEPDVYLTTARDGTGYGDGTVVAVRVDPAALELDDEFPDGRKDFRLPVGRNQRVGIKLEAVPESSRAAGGTSGNPATSLESPAELAANQKANESILRALGLPTAKGTRVWGGKKIQAALAKLATDERYPATTRRMAQELAARPLDNLLLKIEADARLNWAGLYQPFNDGRGELSLNTRTMGRGELDIGISLVHEVLHHATYQALRNPKTARQKQAAKELRALYTRAKAALAANEQLSQFDYELSNLDEFITGLWTRADFQTALAGIPADTAPTLGQRVRSVLDEIFRVLSELVTGKAVAPGSVLEASMAASLRLMEDGQPSVQGQLRNAVLTQGPGSITIRPRSQRAVKAYHGTPHKVDKFTTGKIGTGEGAQAYGWGLYFAQGKAVAEQYRQRLSASALTLDGVPIAEVAGPSNNYIWGHAQQYYADGAKSKSALLDKLQSAREYERDRGNKYFKDGDFTEVINAVSAAQEVGMETDGNLYTVELIPDEADFLDWDKPLSEQSEKVKAALADVGESPGDIQKAIDFLTPKISMEGRQAGLAQKQIDQLKVRLGNVNLSSGAQFYNRLGEAPVASAILAKAGIPGIRYLDGGSRGAGDGTRNFVVFDENNIRITEANGQPVDGWQQPAEPDPLQNPAFRLAARVLPLHERGEPFRVKQLGTRAILTGSPLPSDVTQVLAMTENERQAVAQAAAQVGNDLQAAVKAYLDRTGQDERATWDKINAVMEGQPGALTLLTAIDPALGERSRRARNMLDDLSAAVAQTLPTGSLRDAITQNQGSWMRRGYAAFDPESGWNFDGLTKAAKAGRQIGGKDAAKILADARAYLRTQNPQNGRTLKEWNADIEADMRDLMDRDAWQSANLGGNTLRKNVSSFMRRKDIAPEIRALMGEETNPLHRFVKSAAFQAQIVARHHGQLAVRALGLQTGLFKTQRGEAFTELIEPSENRWSGLAGVWTTPEMKAALANSSAVNREGTDIGGWLVGTLKALGNEAKLNRVALNPDSWVVNILGNVVGLVQSGDVFAWDFARRLTDARALIKSGKARPGSMQTAAQSALVDAQRAMLGRLRGMGVLGSSITLADIEASIPRHLLQWVAEDRARNAGLGAVKGAIVGQAAGRGLGVAGRVVGGVAGGIGGAIAGAQRLQNWQQTVADYVMTGPDALARVTGWLTNYETALAAGQNGDQAAASATTKTLNTFPNYNKLPALLRQLSRLGFTGSFIAFQWEVYRNFGWNVKYAVEELGSGNAAIQARGMRRLAGIGSVAALAGGGLAALLSAAGAAGDDDERNKIWRQWFAAPWEKDAVLAFDKYDKDGVSYYNTSYLLPQMTMMELIQGASEGRDPADSASRVVNRLSEQFINGSVHLQPLLSAFANQDRFGRKITNAEGMEGAAARADEAVQVILEPGFADKITRLTYALRGAEKNERKFSVEEEMKRLAGIRQVSRTWEELVKRRYSQFTYAYKGVRDDANKILGENLPGAPVRAVKMVNDKVIELQQQMADYERDLRRLGVPEATIKAAKKDSSLQRLNPVRVRADGRRVETVTGR
jgi:hypothetical protein